MLFVKSTLKGYTVEASDGKIGVVRDFLFDDQSWKIRWLVLDAGSWLPRRKILLHPSALAAPEPLRKSIAVKLTKAEVEGSPDFLEHQPVSRQMEAHLYDYYGWHPTWGSSYSAWALSPRPFRRPHWLLASRQRRQPPQLIRRRRMRIYGAPARLRAIMSTPPMARSAMLRILFSITPIGTSVTLASTPRTGGLESTS